MDRLILWWDDCLERCKLMPKEHKEKVFHQAFGAGQFYLVEHNLPVTDEFENLWEEYRKKFEKEMWG